MKFDQKERKILKVVLILVISFVFAMTISSNAFSEKASSPTRVIKQKKIGRAIPESNPTPVMGGEKITRTGTIDRIGKNEIVIDDTWFKISDDVSISGYRVGNTVKYTVIDKYEIIELRHSDKPRKKKTKK